MYAVAPWMCIHLRNLLTVSIFFYVFLILWTFGLFFVSRCVSLCKNKSDVSRTILRVDKKMIWNHWIYVICSIHFSQLICVSPVRLILNCVPTMSSKGLVELKNKYNNNNNRYGIHPSTFVWHNQCIRWISCLFRMKILHY
jgi:hypothetical protein